MNEDAIVDDTQSVLSYVEDALVNDSQSGLSSLVEH